MLQVLVGWSNSSRLGLGNMTVCTCNSRNVSGNTVQPWDPSLRVSAVYSGQARQLIRAGSSRDLAECSCLAKVMWFGLQKKTLNCDIYRYTSITHIYRDKLLVVLKGKPPVLHIKVCSSFGSTAA